MVLRELLGPADLPRAQTLCIYETTEVIVVYKDENLMFAVFQIMTLRLKDLDDSQKLAVVDLIPSLCRKYFPKKNATGHYWPKSVLVTTLSRLVPEAS